MAYTPINWQTGDTITAEKLNRCDNGWGVGSTELFSETVTTTDTGQGYATGQLAYVFQQEPPAEAVVTFDGTDYVCERDSQYGYGGSNDFSTYPFYISPATSQTSIYTETAGAHTVSFGIATVDVGDIFAAAVKLASGTFAAVAGVTAWVDVFNAMSSGKLVYIVRASSEAAQCNIATRVYYDGEEANPFRVSTITALNSPTVEEFVANTENGTIQIEL